MEELARALFLLTGLLVLLVRREMFPPLPLSYPFTISRLGAESCVRSSYDRDCLGKRIKYDQFSD